MNLEDVRRLYRYNAWANVSFFDALESVPAHDYERNLESSHGGLHGTLTHLVGAEEVWLARWRGTPDAKLLSPGDVASPTELRARWQRIESDRGAFIAALTEEKLREEFSMTTTTGKTFLHPYWQMLQHLVNHSSYHRGQLAGLMRQIGHKPPQTDLIKFYRDFPNER